MTIWAIRRNWQAGAYRLTRPQRLHVRKNGQTYVGLPAFIMLWREIPQTCWLAHIFDMPGIHWTAARVYNHLLAPIL